MTLVNLQESRSRFTFKEKLIRIVWNTCWYLVSFLPRPASFIRILILRMFGAEIGKNCLIETNVKIWLPWQLKMADYVAIGRHVEIYNYAKVTINSMTIISQYSYLCTGYHDYKNPHFPLLWEPISIGSECWIAAGTWIMPGVSIGSGTVIGAKSLVTKTMPEWMVCAGHPCQPIKERVIEEVKQLQL